MCRLHVQNVFLSKEHLIKTERANETHKHSHSKHVREGLTNIRILYMYTKRLSVVGHNAYLLLMYKVTFVQTVKS